MPMTTGARLAGELYGCGLRERYTRDERTCTAPRAVLSLHPRRPGPQARALGLVSVRGHCDAQPTPAGDCRDQ